MPGKAMCLVKKSGVVVALSRDVTGFPYFNLIRRLYTPTPCPTLEGERKSINCAKKA